MSRSESCWTRRHHGSCIALPFLFLLSTAGMHTTVAQEGPVMSAFPSNEFQFTGTWNCAGSFRTAKVHRSIFTGSVILEGKWLKLSEQDIEPATGYVATYLIGYDPQQKQLVEYDANNFGAGTYASEQGWKNGVLTMTSPVKQHAKASYIADRFLYSIADRDKFTVDWQVRNNAASEWVTADQQVCSRSQNG